jgi:hypothetical protein
MQENGITRLQTIFGAGFLGETVATEFKDEKDGGAPEPIPIIQRNMKIVWDQIVAAGLDYTIWCPADFPGGEVATAYVTAVNGPPN